LELPDGDFVDLDWTPASNQPLVTVFHGLEGSIDSKYAVGIMAAIHRRGWRGVLMHFRGCSGSPNRLARTYHSGDTGDIGYLLDVLSRRARGRQLAAVGFSLGGNALLKYLGERGRRALPVAAAVVSVPFDLDNAARRLEQGFSRFYQWYLLRKMRAKAAAKYGQSEAYPTAGELNGLKTFRAFDDKVTAPVHGFADVDDYYGRCSSRQYLATVTVPTLLLHAADDPFMTSEAIPEPSQLSNSVCLEVSRKGGHVGFVAGNIPGCAHYWLESRIIRFLDGYLGVNR
jgi:predicted alpha/beta-fold hydrolase